MATVAKCRFDVEVCGGIYVNEACVVDRNLVSGRTFHDHGKYMGSWMKLLDQERAKLRDASIDSASCKVAVTS
jgi:protease I